MSSTRVKQNEFSEKKTHNSRHNGKAILELEDRIKILENELERLKND